MKVFRLTTIDFWRFLEGMFCIECRRSVHPWSFRSSRESCQKCPPCFFPIFRKAKMLEEKRRLSHLWSDIRTCSSDLRLISTGATFWVTPKPGWPPPKWRQPSTNIIKKTVQTLKTYENILKTGWNCNKIMIHHTKSTFESNASNSLDILDILDVLHPKASIHVVLHRHTVGMERFEEAVAARSDGPLPQQARWGWKEISTNKTNKY